MPLDPVVSPAPAAPSSAALVVDAATGPAYQAPANGTLAAPLRPGQLAPAAASFTITVPCLPDFLWQAVAELLPAQQRPNLARVCKPILRSLNAVLHADKLEHDAALAVTPSAIAAVLHACKPPEPLYESHRDKRVCLPPSRPALEPSRHAQILDVLLRTVFRLPYRTQRKHEVVQAVLELPAGVRGLPLTTILSWVRRQTSFLDGNRARCFVEETGVTPERLLQAIMDMPPARRCAPLCAMASIAVEEWSTSTVARWVEYARELPPDDRGAVLAALVSRANFYINDTYPFAAYMQLLQANQELVDTAGRPHPAQAQLLVGLRRIPFPDLTEEAKRALWDAMIRSAEGLPLGQRGTVMASLAAKCAWRTSPSAQDKERIEAAARDLPPADREKVMAALHGAGAHSPAYVEHPFANGVSKADYAAPDAILKPFARLPAGLQFRAIRDVAAQAFSLEDSLALFPIRAAMLEMASQARHDAASDGDSMTDEWNAIFSDIRDYRPEQQPPMWDILAGSLARVVPPVRAEVLLSMARRCTDIDERMWVLQQARALPAPLQPLILCHLCCLGVLSSDRRQLAVKPFLAQAIVAIAALPPQYRGLPLQPLCELRQREGRPRALQDLWDRLSELEQSIPPEDVRFD